jgi:hypothetical protein
MKIVHFEKRDLGHIEIACILKSVIWGHGKGLHFRLHFQKRDLGQGSGVGRVPERKPERDIL